MKKTLLFFSAAFSLLMTGVLLKDNLDAYKLTLLTTGLLCGIILIYDVKPVDKSGGLFKKITHYLSYKKHIQLKQQN